MLIKKFRNKIPLILVITLVLSISIINMDTKTVYAGNNFWSSEAIADFIDNEVDVSENILNDNKYKTNITREEFAELIISMYVKANNLNKEDIPLEENPFKDTDSIDVQRAYSLGIVKGISENEYAPTANITREELATIITRFLNVSGINTDTTGNLSNFPDENKVSEWAYNSMFLCVNEGIIKGTLLSLDPKTYAQIIGLDPKANTSIEQALVMLDRLAVKYEWFTPSKDKYYSGFLVPRDTELVIYTNGISIKIDWDKITDHKKLENDLYYMITSKLNDTEQINDLIRTILNTESYYANGYTQDFSKFFKIEEYTFEVLSSYQSSVTWIYISSF